MASSVHDALIRYDNYFIRVADRAEPVSDNDRGPVLRKPVERLLDIAFTHWPQLSRIFKKVSIYQLGSLWLDILPPSSPVALGQGIGPDGADPERGRVEEEAFVIKNGLEEARVW
ncbi:hypothetical protein KAR29_09380 [Aminithiophilus ramosus]|uniref:Uncharacterized protein n=2 Tax=Synergistales TaxID=649776 RepID=A0A9Q7ABK4_9BACT|nr:hypothetical protein [Aminithiophilus ramosus]QTX31574.1 hypothetical protein KAR29_09380 [Aminithiophilus ramosus]QVL35381.1 hypothetical protein KIH16_09225 [Synergistota bacterium]